MRFFTPLIKVFCIGSLSACASIVGSKSTPVTITSVPSGAKVEILDRDGMMRFTGQTPTTATLANGDGYFTKARYSVKLSKPGYDPSVTSLASSTNGWYWANVFWGLPGVVIGMLLIDPISGAMYEIDQESLSLALNPSRSPEARTPLATPSDGTESVSAPE